MGIPKFTCYKRSLPILPTRANHLTVAYISTDLLSMGRIWHLLRTGGAGGEVPCRSARCPRTFLSPLAGLRPARRIM